VSLSNVHSFSARKNARKLLVLTGGGRKKNAAAKRAAFGKSVKGGGGDNRGAALNWRRQDVQEKRGERSRKHPSIKERG